MSWKIHFVQVFHCVSGACVCAIVNVYLPSGPHRKREREKKNRTFFDFVATLRECPIFMCGDFQMNASHSETLSSALASGKWSDIAYQIAHAHGHETHTVMNLSQHLSVIEGPKPSPHA